MDEIRKILSWWACITTFYEKTQEFLCEKKQLYIQFGELYKMFIKNILNYLKYCSVMVYST